MTEDLAMPFPSMEFRFPCRIATEFAPPVSYVMAAAEATTITPDPDELTLPPIVIDGDSFHDGSNHDHPHSRPKLPLPKQWRAGKVLFLRQLCQERGLHADGTKPELIARLENYRNGGGVLYAHNSSVTPPTIINE